jgi:hypothetical protein
MRIEARETEEKREKSGWSESNMKATLKLILMTNIQPRQRIYFEHKKRGENKLQEIN